jgi:formate-dependent phosphoribosylglycinamide formyltransferase (GAR transformylase)
MIADNFTEDKIVSQNLNNFALRLRSVAALAVEDKIMIEIIVVGNSYKTVQVSRQKRIKF